MSADTSRRALDLHVARDRSPGARDLDLAIDHARTALGLNLTLDRSPARAGDRRIAFHRLAQA
jgi:hypothetical protein